MEVCIGFLLILVLVTAKGIFNLFRLWVRRAQKPDHAALMISGTLCVVFILAFFINPPLYWFCFALLYAALYIGALSENVANPGAIGSAMLLAGGALDGGLFDSSEGTEFGEGEALNGSDKTSVDNWGLSLGPDQQDIPPLEWIDSYVKEDGTKVNGHWRTKADGIPWNNLRQ